MISSILTVAFAALATAAPAKRQSTVTDTQILNYALTLEHLENNFYHMGINNFTEADFAAAGEASMDFYTNLKEISHDEETHVAFLTKALGAAAVVPNEYAFPVTDVKSFLAVANVLEGVGVSAYLGAAKYIMDKDYLTAAGEILTVEARHSAFWRGLNNQSPFPYPFEIPLDFDEVYSLAVQFITKDNNAGVLPFMAFPAITAAPAGVAQLGATVDLTVAKAVNAVGAYFIGSQGAISAPLTGSGMSYSIIVPNDAQSGQEYLVLTKDMNMPTDDNIVAGPVVIEVADVISSLASTSSASGMSAASPAAAAPAAAAPAPAASPVQELPDGQIISEAADGQLQAYRRQ